MKDIHLEDFLPHNQEGGDSAEEHAEMLPQHQEDSETSGSTMTPQRRSEQRRPATCPRTRSRSINSETGSHTATPPARRRRTAAATPTTTTSRPVGNAGDEEAEDFGRICGDELVIETPQGPVRIVQQGDAYKVHTNGDQVQVDKETLERIHEEDLGD